jgi:hypothetical protein
LRKSADYFSRFVLCVEQRIQFQLPDVESASIKL